MRRLARPLALAALALFAATAVACRESTAPRPAAGFYLLRSIGGQRLPAYPFPDSATRVLEEALRIHPNGTYGRSRTWAIRIDGAFNLVALGDSGTVTFRGGHVTLERLRSNAKYDAVIDGTTITVDDYPGAWVYVRQ